jgi:hypothetical protein
MSETRRWLVLATAGMASSIESASYELGSLALAITAIALAAGSAFTYRYLTRPPQPGGCRGSNVMSVLAPAPWLARRLFPVLATAGLLAVGMVATTCGAHLISQWGAQRAGGHGWTLPHDLWGTLTAAHRLVHLDVSGLYTPPTSLITFPGAALILVPVVAVIDAAGLGLAAPGGHNPHPGSWLLAGPYEIALSSVVLFAADATARRLGVAPPKRALLAAAGAVAVGSVSLGWGHPEDAVAVGLLLYATLALADHRAGRSAWLIGAAVAVQPLVLLALPVILTVVEPRRLPGFLTRAAAPAVLLLAAAAAANWPATIHAVTSQPNWPGLDHLTPWTSLAPHLGDGAVAAGPARALAILLACGCALAARHRWRPARQMAGMSPGMLRELLWWVAVAAASALTFVSQASWRGHWTWWGTMMAGLALILLFAAPAWPPRRPRSSGRLARDDHAVRGRLAVEQLDQRGAVLQHLPLVDVTLVADFPGVQVRRAGQHDHPLDPRG